MTPPGRPSLASRLPVPAMTSRVKKYVHAAILGLATGGLSFLAFNLESVITLPKGAKGAILGILVMGIGKAAGYVLAELPTHDTTPPAPPA